MMHRISFLTLSIAFLGFSAAAKCPLNLKGGDAVSASVYIATVDSGRTLVSYDSKRLLTPASIMKSLTVASAYRILGPDFRWTTTVMRRGKVEGSTLHGDLIIKGGGDPTLSSRHFKEQPSFFSAVSAALRDNGISKITGEIVIDSSLIPDPGAVPSWEVEDIPWDYGAGAFAVNYSDNTFSLQIPDMKAFPAIPGLKVINQIKPKSGQLALTRGVGSSVITVTGSLGQRKQATLQCSMPDPGAVLAQRLEASLKSLGITFAHEKSAGSGTSETILEYKSPRLADVGRSLMVRSDNLMAEATLRALALGAPLDSALIKERRLWRSQGIDLSYCKINDGSGLSRANAISAELLGAVLRNMANNPQLAPTYIDSFARVGLDGTLTSFLAKSPRKKEFVLKSGSMGGVQCYTGYRLDPDDRHPTHVIVVMINNIVGPRSDIRKAVESLLLSTF